MVCLFRRRSLPDVFCGEIHLLNKILVKIMTTREFTVLNEMYDIFGHLPVLLGQQRHGGSPASRVP